MKSLTRPSFWRAYESLDPRVRIAVRRAYKLFADDPEHPSLRFNKLQGYDDIWSVRISEQYRAVGKRDGDIVTWFGSDRTMILITNLDDSRFSSDS